MALYAMSFGFRQPYQVLIDAEMCTSAITLKLEIVKQFGVVLQGTIKPMITQCCIHELYLSGKSNQPAVDLAKTFERRKCNHREPIPGDECLADVVGDTNKHRYVLATQSQPLRSKLRNIPAVPIVHINRSVVVLEPPSDSTIKAKEMNEEQALHPTAPDMALISTAKPEEPPRKRRKGPKGPNPLSMKKKKVTPESASAAKKDKGKEKAKTAQASTVFAETKVGEKRKREQVDRRMEELDHGDDDHAVSKHIAGGHKRKRRRKATVHNASTGEDIRQ